MALVRSSVTVYWNSMCYFLQCSIRSKQHIAKEKKEIPTRALTGHSDINNDKMVGNLRQWKVGGLKGEILEKRKLNGNVITSIHKEKA